MKIEAAINETLDGDDEKTDKQQKNQKRVPIMRSEENHPALTK